MFSSQKNGNPLFIEAFIRSEYPDAILEKDGVEYRVEFEYKSSNFISHKHDVRDCDLILCWKNDLDENIGLPVIALSIPNWSDKEIIPASDLERESYYWKSTAIELQNELRNLRKELNSGISGYKVYLPKEMGLTIEQRQEIVEQMVEDGLPNKTMADALNVSEITIKNDKKAIAEVTPAGNNGHQSSA